VYALAMPTHPRVIEHLRYFLNFLGSEYDLSGELINLLLALAYGAAPGFAWTLGA
jgi:hypothetical protein